MNGWTVRCRQDVTYRINAVVDVFSPANEALAEAADVADGKRYLVVVDRTVDSLYGDRIDRYFGARGARTVKYTLGPGERVKTADSLLDIARTADQAGIRRRCEPIIAVGGGVVTDLAGMAASLYRRGTPFIRVPTTLVGLVDAAIGAKTAINHNGHKNRLGTYFPAAHTLLDPTFLRTLPARHVRNGMAEIVKIAVMKDATLFALLEADSADLVESRIATAHGTEIIERSVTAMLGELEANLWEHELRRVADFGHTFSPQLEMCAGDLLHGEAVAIDMALCCAIAHLRGLLSDDALRRVFALLQGLGLPTEHEACTSRMLLGALADTVRHRDGHQHLPLPTGIGSAVFVEDVTPAEIAAARDTVRRLQPIAANR
ncbi:sedoheptulose 7-phosphate cyclase [Actinoplanes teichomyceticus]|uniref:2-epi-5-epi-valiolone synthase n=1 Tax=Actinoplanes teichomyceticus TaxID=1867 RepID=A0A561WKP8_ACTTI|nr:sedoheptulose 7-phosphate cyclase [Actinoplanes teichomyceticus]TWG24438.1 3-dehydroquinate synthase [Actinoplanes teichomyceticus]GIF12711.1 3-dehydroquinate synthase [Actinoplanes teichomyceticus]